MKLIISIIMLLVVAGCSNNPNTAIYKQKIIGRWAMNDPQNVQLQFTQTEELAYNGGNLTTIFKYHIGDDDVLTAIDKKGTPYDWHIIKLTNDSLVLNLYADDYVQRFVRIPLPAAH